MLTAAFWLTSTALMYFAGTSVLGDRRLGALAAALFPLTPLLVRVGRPSADPLLFVVAWLLALMLGSQPSRTAWLLVAGGSLGLGLYSGLTSLVMMPLYLGVTVIWLFLYRPREPLPFVFVVGAFAVAAIPLAIFIARHPDYLAGEINRLGIYDARAYGVIHGTREVLNWIGLTARSGVYYDYFSPAFLFFPEETLAGTVRYPQIFLLPFAVLVPAGIYRALKHPVTPAAALTLAGFLTSPLAASLDGPNVGRRIVFMVPFAVLLAAWGAGQLLSSPSASVRRGAWALLAGVPASFVTFYLNLR